MVVYNENVVINAPFTLSVGSNMSTNGVVECREFMEHLSRGTFMSRLYDHTFTPNDCIKFWDKYEYNGEHRSVKLHSVLVEGDPYIICEQGMGIEKDVVATGMFDSLEGEIALNAGDGYAPGWSYWSTTYDRAKTTGGITSTKNPFIWLAKGGIFGSYGTLEIRVTAANDNWDWGHLELGNLTAHGAIKSANNGAGYRSYYGGGGGGAQGGTYIDEYGNMCFDGGGGVGNHAWCVKASGNPIFYIWDNGGAVFCDGNGNAKAGISNGGNISTSGTITVGTIPYKSVSGPLYASSQAGSVGTICYNGSSKRFKTNIEDLSDCSWVYNLKPVTFNSKFDIDGDRQIGLIAEDVNEFCPQLVFSDVDGKIAGVHYEWLGIPLLVEVKKLHNRIEALENQLNHKQTAA